MYPLTASRPAAHLGLHDGRHGTGVAQHAAMTQGTMYSSAGRAVQAVMADLLAFQRILLGCKASGADQQAGRLAVTQQWPGL